MPSQSFKPLRLGTRGSLLARTQSGTFAATVADLLGFPVEEAVQEVIIRTEGDDSTKPLNESKTPGLFVNALRDALVRGEVDFIVHSFKDLPTGSVDGIALVAVPEREDLSDVLVSKGNLKLSELPMGAVLGTSSPRRSAKLQFVRPDLVVRPIRGNIDTRIAKVRSGEYDATVLAAAGLKRIGRLEEAAEHLGLDVLLPAPAQGALAVECRSDDEHTRAILSQLDNPEVRVITAAERAILVGVGATCSTAVGAVAEIIDGVELLIRAELSHPTPSETGIEYERFEISAVLSEGLATPAALSEAHQLGLYAAARLLETPLGHRVLAEISAERAGLD